MTETLTAQFDGQNALITGGGTGIGRAAAIALAAEGATVTVAGRTEATLQMLATNVQGMFFSMKHELALMVRQGAGSIVNISSGVRLVGVRGYSGYAASKHAEIGLTKSTALDDGHLGIRVTALCPGLVNTPLIAEMINENPTMHEELVASHASVASQSPRRSPTRSCGCPRHVPAT